MKSGRPILYSLCQYGRADVWKWGADVGGNTWRTTGDIRDSWDSMTKIGFAQDELAEWASPGHWNDPDMLEIGNGGMNDDEYRTHMSLWAILAAPLLAGNDLRNMTREILEILTNREVITISQDKAGKQGRRVSKSGELEVWARTLFDGAVAIGMFNRGSAPAQVSVTWTETGLKKTPPEARELWQHSEVKMNGALQIDFEPSSVTSSEPSGATVTPTGRPQTWPLSTANTSECSGLPSALMLRKTRISPVRRSATKKSPLAAARIKRGSLRPEAHNSTLNPAGTCGHAFSGRGTS